ncbi:MAG: hypothetical protein U0Y08_11015 [Bacteroidia bacterium]
MKTIIKSIFMTGVLMFCALNIQAQKTESKPRAASEPQSALKTRRFLVNYLNVMDTCKTWEDKSRTLKGIEMVADATFSDWISQYHAAFFNAVLAMENKDTAAASAMLAKAEMYIGKAVALNKDESEIILLRGLITGMKIGKHPELGAKLGPIAMGDYEKAMKLNAENPRVYLVYGESYMYMPEQAGGGKKPAKENFEIALKKFETDKHEDPAWPRWGKDRAKKLLEEVKEQ